MFHPVLQGKAKLSLSRTQVTEMGSHEFKASRPRMCKKAQTLKQNKAGLYGSLQGGCSGFIRNFVVSGIPSTMNPAEEKTRFNPTVSLATKSATSPQHSFVPSGP